MRLRHAVAPLWLAGLRTVASLRAPVPGGFRIVLIHDVPDRDLPAFVDLVERVVERHGTVSPEEAETRLAKGGTPARPGRAPVLFSFDDGFLSNLRAAEILAERGIRAQFFVCPGIVDLEGDAQRLAIAAKVFRGRVLPDDLGPERRLMTWDEIARMDAMGHRIGAHGATHRRLSDLEGTELEDEVAGSGERLREMLGTKADWFAFPFGTVGSVDDRVLAVVAKHFRYCRSGVRGMNGSGTHPMAVRADSVDLSAPPIWRHLVLEGGLDARYRVARRRLEGFAAVR